VSETVRPPAAENHIRQRAVGAPGGVRGRSNGCAFSREAGKASEEVRGKHSCKASAGTCISLTLTQRRRGTCACVPFPPRFPPSSRRPAAAFAARECARIGGGYARAWAARVRTSVSGASALVRARPLCRATAAAHARAPATHTRRRVLTRKILRLVGSSASTAARLHQDLTPARRHGGPSALA